MFLNILTYINWKHFYRKVTPVINFLEKQNWERVILIFLSGVFIFKAVMMLDPDFGWRLRTGFYILKNGVPKVDLYSYTMPSFPWVDHAWMTDVLISSLYRLTGMFGLGILFSALTIFAVLIPGRGLGDLGKNLNSLKKLNLDRTAYSGFINPVLLLAFAILMPFMTVRVQVMTWLLLSVLIFIIFNEQYWKRFRLLTPLYFLLWANLHGGFLSGLVVLGIVLFFRFLKRKSDVFDLVILTLSILVTFVNPYGAGVYREIWSSVSDNQLRFEILEWQPAFLSFDIPSIFLVSISTIFVFYYRRKFSPEMLIVYLLLLVQGVSSVRHFPLWVLFSIPMTLKAIGYFQQDTSRNKISASRFEALYRYLWLGCLVVLCFQTWFSIKGALYMSERKFYPTKAISFLKEKNYEGQLFSDYGWGGYLIWKYPEKKVFIDGRMPSWKNSEHYTSESGYAMKEYLGVMRGKENYKPIFEKYSVKAVLWPKKREPNFLDKAENKMSEKFNFLYKILGLSDKKFFLPDTLEKDGWKKVYEDDNASIYISG